MDESPFRHLFPEEGGFIHIEVLLWQLIFLLNQLICQKGRALVFCYVI